MRRLRAAPEVEPAREAVVDEVRAASPATVDPGSAGDVAPEVVSTPTAACRRGTGSCLGLPAGKRRQALLVGLVLVVLAIVAWYFLLRDDGDASAAPSGESGTVAAVSLTGSVHPPGIPAA